MKQAFLSMLLTLPVAAHPGHDHSASDHSALLPFGPLALIAALGITTFLALRHQRPSSTLAKNRNR